MRIQQLIKETKFPAPAETTSSKLHGVMSKVYGNGGWYSVLRRRSSEEKGRKYQRLQF